MVRIPAYLKDVVHVWRQHGVYRALSEPGVAAALLKEQHPTRLLFHTAASHHVPLSLLEEATAVGYAWLLGVARGFLQKR